MSTRCKFGRPHRWLTAWFDSAGILVTDRYLCNGCGSERAKR